MEVLASVLGSFVARPAQILCDSIYSKVRSAFKFKSNFNALIERKKEILNTADKEEKSPNHQVTKWLEEVEGIEKEVNPTQADTPGNGNILCGCCSNCCLHYRLGKKVAEKLEQVKGFMNGPNFPDCILVANRRVKPVEHIRGPVIESQTAASKNLDKIMDLLNDDAVRILGIWGMGGVGKTTLVRSLNQKLESNSSQQPFGIVIWVTVSKDFDLEKVQTQIAKRLNLDVKSEESRERADKLYQSLRKEKKFLLILDDVWKKIDFDSLGVPQPEEHMGAKIILTSRLSEVCAQMRAHPVKVDVLTNEEAWQLFIKEAGKEASLENIKQHAKAVANECGRLPLALITVGAAMRGKYMPEEWENALNELQQAKLDLIKDVEPQVYKPLRWSYDSLQGKNIKPCFLYCSLFPEDFLIDENELLQCWMAEGLIDENNYEASRAKGIAIIKKLKDSCLLENGFSPNSLKMHDVVRDVAIWIAYTMEDGCRSLVFSGKGLSQIPKVELWKSSKRISFMDSKITTLPDCPIQCPNTSTLLLQGNDLLEIVPDIFLRGFQVLRVLNMSGSRIKSLPLSLTQLGELRALLLYGCECLEEIPPLGGLRKLQVLDLGWTMIRKLPEGIEELSNLSQLNLSETRRLKTIPARVISKLSGLEVLEMEGSDYKWGLMEKVEMGEATLEVLGYLTRLTFLRINLWSLPNQELDWIKNLKGFNISVGSFGSYMNDVSRRDERRLHLLELDLDFPEGSGSLIKNATHLTLYGCTEIDSIFGYLIRNTQVLAGLKSLKIDMSDGSLMYRPPYYHHIPNIEVVVLVCCNLEELVLVGCRQLDYFGRPPGVSLGLRLSKLRLTEVKHCQKLKYLIHVELIPCLINLEEIDISACDELEKVIEYDDSSDKIMAAHPVLPKLRKLSLRSLPELTSICRSENLSWRSLEVLQVFGCKQLKRLPLTTQNANTVKEIEGEEEWWSELVWDDDNDNTKLALQPHFKPLCVFEEE